MGAHLAPPLVERERSELQSVVSGERFARSPRLAKLLVYLCNKYFEGEADQIKEYNIATEVLGRPAEFDPSQDAIARVEAYRLRRKLKEYYAAEGANHPVKIVLSPGTYVPVFTYSSRLASQVMPAKAEHDVAEVASSGPIQATGLILGAADEPRSDPGLSMATAMPPPLILEPKGPAQKVRWWAWFAVAAGLLGVLAALILALTPHRATSSPANVARSNGVALRTAAGATAAAPVSSVRFLAGGTQHSHTDPMGNIWQPDEYFSGGRPGTNPHEFLWRTNDPMLFENVRDGEFSYNIPLKPGVYELHLFFVETMYGPGMITGGGENTRTFLVQLNGQTFLDNFDIIADATGPNIADERVFRDIQPAADGQLHLAFFSQRGQPIVSAIEILPGIEHRQVPIRLVTERTPFTDHEGKLWSPDNYYSGGQQTIHKEPVTGTPDPDLYLSERYGNFSYAIPADSRDSYTVTLHFAETYWGGPLATPGSGTGRRVFNVDSNGVRLLKNLDIYKEVGGMRALTKIFHGLRPNAQGKLLLSFEPVVNYASVFGIEIEDEGQ
ncbi:MAG: malectin domain-containing carbohydrate-binding protein [Bryobacteraceae bacterium]